MRAVNLLPAERRKREREAPRLTPLHGAGLAIVAGALALGYWGHSVSGQVDTEKAKVADLEAKTDTLTKQIAKAKAGTVDVSSYETDRALVTGLASARVNWSTVMINLSRVAPQGIWLDSMSITTPTSDTQAAASTPGAKRPAAITLTANTPSRTAGALFLSRLNAIQGFAEPRLAGGINPVEEDGKTKAYTFTVEIPVDDAIFGSARPVRPAASTPATSTPSNP